MRHSIQRETRKGEKMTTLIATYNSEGCTGRCDAKCYDATTPDCDCICGGRNHGAGAEQAIDNTRALAEEWLADWKRKHPDTTGWLVPAAQLSLPLFEVERHPSCSI